MEMCVPEILAGQILGKAGCRRGTVLPQAQKGSKRKELLSAISREKTRPSSLGEQAVVTAVTAFTLGFIIKVRPDLARASAGEAPQ